MKRKFLSIMTAAFLLLCACSSAETGEREEPEGEVDYTTYQSYWMPQFDHTVMPVAAFLAPPIQEGAYAENFINDEQYRILAESGINTAYGLTETLPAHASDVRRALELCDRYGLSYLASVSGIHTMKTQSQVEYAISALLTNNFPALGGVIVRDEPAYSELERMSGVKESLGNLLPGKLYHTNLFPDYASAGQLYNRLAETPALPQEGYSYEQYVDDCIAVYQPQILSYDYYPMVGEGVRQGYFKNMSLIRSRAEEAGIPFWVYVQTCSYAPDVRIPTRAEILWMVNSSLAYGAKGIQYFTYFLPNDGAEIFQGAMIDRDGNKTAVYDYVQAANRQIAAVDEVLMRSLFRGLVAVGTSPCPIPEMDIVQDRGALVSAEGEHLLVGVFDYRGKDAYYLLNNSIDEEDSVSLAFAGKGYAVRGAVRSDMKGTYSADLQAGEGVLIVLE